MTTHASDEERAWALIDEEFKHYKHYDRQDLIGFYNRIIISFEEIRRAERVRTLESEEVKNLKAYADHSRFCNCVMDPSYLCNCKYDQAIKEFGLALSRAKEGK